MDPTCFCELDESIGHVFPLFVILQLLHLGLEVVLCQSLVDFEGLESITFPFESHSSPV
jgi:hypothetical protein